MVCLVALLLVCGVGVVGAVGGDVGVPSTVDPGVAAGAASAVSSSASPGPNQNNSWVQALGQSHGHMGL